MRIIPNLQEGESSSLELTLGVTHFSMKLHCRNTHTQPYSLSPPVKVRSNAGSQEAELVEKSVRCVV